MAIQIQVRRGAASAWTSANPTLAAGELGFETDTGLLKVGTGSTAWTSLSYVTPSLVAIANGGTGKTTAPAAMANLMGYTSTATAAGTTTLTNTSSYYQQFTGTTTQTVQLPVTNTLQTGWTFHIVNNSTGNVTVNSSGGNSVIVIPAGTTAMVTCIGTSLTTAADWEYGLTDFSTYTGSGAVVMGTAPTINNTILTGTLTAASSAGTSGQVLTSTGTGVQWSTPSAGAAFSEFMLIGC